MHIIIFTINLKPWFFRLQSLYFKAGSFIFGLLALGPQQAFFRVYSCPCTQETRMVGIGLTFGCWGLNPGCHMQATWLSFQTLPLTIFKKMIRVSEVAITEICGDRDQTQIYSMHNKSPPHTVLSLWTPIMLSSTVFVPSLIWLCPCSPTFRCCLLLMLECSFIYIPRRRKSNLFLIPASFFLWK